MLTTYVSKEYHLFTKCLAYLADSLRDLNTDICMRAHVYIWGHSIYLDILLLIDIDHVLY
jgi:hypothetical protein